MSLNDPAGRSQAPDPAPAPDPSGVLDRIILRASVNLLAGAPGAGKTALLAYLLTQFRDQAPIFGYQPSPVPKIAFIGADRSWTNSTRLWFEAAGYPEIPSYSLQDDRSFNPHRLRVRANRIAILTECLSRLHPLPPGSLVVIDPLALFLGGNLIDYDTCAVACTQIRRLCQDRDITIIGTAHSAKIKADKKARYLRLQDRILGSAALYGYTDTQLYLAMPEETGEKFYSFLWAPHHRPPEVFPLGRDESGLFVPWGEDALSKKEQYVLELIPQAPEQVSFLDLAVASNLSRATLYRYLQGFLKDGRIVKTTPGNYQRPVVN